MPFIDTRPREYEKYPNMLGPGTYLAMLFEWPEAPVTSKDRNTGDERYSWVIVFEEVPENIKQRGKQTRYFIPCDKDGAILPNTFSQGRLDQLLDATGSPRTFEHYDVTRLKGSVCKVTIPPGKSYVTVMESLSPEEEDHCVTYIEKWHPDL